MNSLRLCPVFVNAILLSALLYSASALAQEQTNQTVAKLAAMQRAWGTSMNSPGATLALTEMSRSKVNGHTIVKYRMQASGLPLEKVYSLVNWQIGGQPQVHLEGVTINEAGIAVCAGNSGTCGTPSKPNDPIDLDMMAALGETKRVGLVADDTAKAFANVVPFPNRAVHGGCVLSATIMTPNAEGVLLSASGFQPNSGVAIESVSEGEVKNSVAKADQNGAYETVLQPYRKGVTEGRTQVSVRSGSCHPVLSFAWGKSSYTLQ